jgi:hypothetical protein
MAEFDGAAVDPQTGLLTDTFIGPIPQIDGLIFWFDPITLSAGQDDAITVWNPKLDDAGGYSLLKIAGNNSTFDKHVARFPVVDVNNTQALEENVVDMRVACPGANEAMLVVHVMSMTDITNASIWSACGIRDGDTGGSVGQADFIGWDWTYNSSSQLR